MYCNDCLQKTSTVKVKVKVKDLIENRLKRFLECQLGKAGTEILTSGAGRRLSTFTTCHPETFQIQYYMFIEFCRPAIICVQSLMSLKSEAAAAAP